jgi:membrane associated rhomboid family serine protease
MVLGIIGSYLISWIFDASLYLANIPSFTLPFEPYRLILSPFVGGSLMTVIFLMLFFPSMATRMEHNIGSNDFCVLVATISLLINLSFLVACYALYILMGGAPAALFYTCQGFWPLTFSLIATDCLQGPDMPRRLLFIPYDIPAKYFPLALYAFFMIFSGPQLDDLIGLGLGYADGYGRLEPAKKLLSGIMPTQPPSWAGWSNGGGAPTDALPQMGWSPLAQNDNSSSTGGVGSAAATAAAVPDPFAGSGRTLGTSNHSSATDKDAVNAARLAKLGN